MYLGPGRDDAGREALVHRHGLATEVAEQEGVLRRQSLAHRDVAPSLVGVGAEVEVRASKHPILDRRLFALEYRVGL